MKYRLMLLSIIALLLTTAVFAADSPQFRGPNRDGKFPETGLLKSWPEGGPPVAWVAKGLGGGYGSASVAGDSIYITGMLEDEQGYVFTLDLDGNIKGKVPYGKETQDKQAPGPRSTPTIDENRLYVMSGLGLVSCIDRMTGNILWQVDTVKTFGAKIIQWTIAESVLVDGENLICTPGGPDASLVALNKMTGDTVWTTKGLSDPSAYCSPDIITHNGHRILVTMTAKYVVGVEPASGKVLWTHEHETKYDIHGVTPAYADGLLYYTGGYGSGGGALELSADGSSVTPKWRDEHLDCQHHGVVLLDGYIYGTGHQNERNLVCLELKTGKMMWSAEEVSQGATVYADGRLYVYEGPKEGVVSLVEAGPAGYKIAGRIEVTAGEGLTPKHWAHPTIANGRMYIHHGDALIAYDIAAK